MKSKHSPNSKLLQDIKNKFSNEDEEGKVKELLDGIKKAYKIKKDKSMTSESYLEYRDNELTPLLEENKSIKSKVHELKTFLWEEEDTPFNRATNFSGSLKSNFVDGNSNIKIDNRKERFKLVKTLLDNNKDYTYQELIKYNVDKLQKLYIDSNIKLNTTGTKESKDEELYSLDNFSTVVYKGTGKNRQVLSITIEKYVKEVDGILQISNIVATGKWYKVSGDGDVVEETPPYYFNNYFTDQMVIVSLINELQE